MLSDFLSPNRVPSNFFTRLDNFVSQVILFFFSETQSPFNRLFLRLTSLFAFSDLKIQNHQICLHSTNQNIYLNTRGQACGKEPALLWKIIS